MNKFNIGDYVDLLNMKKTGGEILDFFPNHVTGCYGYKIDWIASENETYKNTSSYISEIVLRPTMIFTVNYLDKI